MIKIRIRNDDHEIDLQFPISENKLYAKLAEIHAIEGKDAPQSAFVTYASDSDRGNRKELQNPCGRSEMVRRLS